MFKTLERRLVILTLLFAAAVAGATWLVATGEPFWGACAAAAALWIAAMMRRGYRKFNSGIIFLLNALENGDYSFRFAGTGARSSVPRERRDVNQVLNAIKEILVHAREREIENEKFLSLIVAAIPVGIAIVDGRDFVRTANDAALRLLGMRVFTHVKQLGLVDEALERAFRSLAPGRRATVRVVDEREERLVSLGMSRITVGRGTMRVVTMHNIAGELEEREMESWIKLIRVMTHEIMNSIAPITSLSETMLAAYGDHGAEADRLRRNTVEAFETITATARGLLSFVGSYRRFTGIPRPELRRVELAELAGRVAALEAPTLASRGIELTTRLDAETVVAADEGQITQVLVNLLKNAAEAIPEGCAGGRIELAVRSDGETVRLDVANNGAPIPAEVLPHIFVPFFTTKPGGTGIGLSVSRYIMRLHGGNLKHRAEEGRTTFSMVFAASGVESDADAATAEDASSDADDATATAMRAARPSRNSRTVSS